MLRARNWGAQAMRTKRHGEISMEYVAAIIIVVALIIVYLIYTGILRVQLDTFMKKFLSFFLGR